MVAADLSFGPAPTRRPPPIYLAEAYVAWRRKTMNCPICGTALADETTPCPTCGRGGPPAPERRAGGPVRQAAQETFDATKRTAKDAVRLSRQAAAEAIPVVEKATREAVDVSKRALHEVGPTVSKVAHATEGAIHGAVQGAKEGAKRATSRPPASEPSSSDTASETK
jgi:hypothetical protein